MGRSIFPFLMLFSGSVMLAFPALSFAGPDPSGVLGKYKRCVFTVNAYTKVECDTTGRQADKRTHWRRNVGTAFPVGEGWYLITMNCVTRNAKKIEVTGSGGECYGVTVVGIDRGARITVLKLDHAAPIPSLVIKPVGAIKSGCGVMFLGVSPGGTLAVTSGSVSTVRERDGMMIVEVTGAPGTSGTPMFDGDGRVAGMLAYRLKEGNVERGRASLKKTYLVLPMEYASLQARSIINRFEAGSGWLGVSTAVNALTVRDVVSRSPAEKCGIKPGDRILEYNGFSVAAPENLLRAAGTTHAGDTVRIKVLRNGETLTFTAKLTAHPETAGK